jgi:hypothetical protein
MTPAELHKSVDRTVLTSLAAVTKQHIFCPVASITAIARR